MNNKVLLVDDDMNLLHGLRRRLDNRFALDTATSSHAALEAIAKFGPYAVVLSDYRMPEMDGIEFLSTVKKQAPDTIRMMLTGYPEVDVATRAVNEGRISRFITKPCPAAELGDHIETGVCEFNAAVRDLQGVVDQVYDPISRAYTRTHFEGVVGQWKKGERLPLAVIMVDINGLRHVNASVGFSQGNALLRKTANLLFELAGSDGMVIRWGDDSFLLLLARTDTESGRAIVRILFERSGTTQDEVLSPSLAVGYACLERQEQCLWTIIGEAEERMLQSKLTARKSDRGATLSALLQTLYESHHETKAHAERLQRTAISLGDALALPSDAYDKLELLASLHDIGKIAIPAAVLNKADSLDREEWELLKTHPEIGFRVARSSEALSHIATEILSHHESWDGTGYPRQLVGTQIPLLSRIIAIVDAYDVMIYGRPYRAPRSSEDALAELQRCSGTQFDAEIVQVFTSLMGKRLV